MTAQENNQQLLCWTICVYRKPGQSEEDHHRYLSDVHAPMARRIMAKYGMVKSSMVHKTSSTQPLLAQIAGPEFDHFADYDTIVSIMFPNIDCILRMKEDPEFKEKVEPDHHNFADLTTTRKNVGWFETHIENGKII